MCTTVNDIAHFGLSAFAKPHARVLRSRLCALLILQVKAVGFGQSQEAPSAPPAQSPAEQGQEAPGEAAVAAPADEQTKDVDGGLSAPPFPVLFVVLFSTSACVGGWFNGNRCCTLPCSTCRKATVGELSSSPYTDSPSPLPLQPRIAQILPLLG